MAYLWISIGAVLGACARFAVTHYSSTKTAHHGFPYGTLFVNVTGSLLAGFVLAYAAGRVPLDSRWRLLLVTGFCGAYTTFSAFAFETMGYAQEGRWGLFALNFLLNNGLCLAAVMVGTRAAAASA
jgi:CrcB protein